MRAKGMYRLIAGLLCMMIVISENSIYTLASTAPLQMQEKEATTEQITVTETTEESLSEIEEAEEVSSTESSGETESIEETSTPGESSVDSEESVAETVSEETETESAEIEIISTESEEVSSVEDLEVELDADGNIASGTIENDKGGITWVIDANGKLTVSGKGEIERVTIGYYSGMPWYEYGKYIKSAYVKLSEIENVMGFFNSCENLEKVDLSGLDTSSTTNMLSMFDGCKKLKELDISNFNTSNVTTMGYMFQDCESLQQLDLSNFDTSKVMNMAEMFLGCKSLKNLSLSSFNTSSVTNMLSMFEGCELLEDIDLGGFDTSNVRNLSRMFYDCENLKKLDVSKFDTSKARNLSDMFYGCESLKKIDVSKFDTSNVTDMSGMFDYCHLLEEIDVSKFDTFNVTDMSDMFSFCYSLEEINVSNFNTSNVTTMSYMFHGCHLIEKLDLGSFDTSNVRHMTQMFGGCKKLKELNISNFNTSSVWGMTGMFSGCRELEEIDLSSFDTSNVTDMEGMFSWCENLKNLDISNFDLSSLNLELEYADGVFYRSNALEKINAPINIPTDISITLPGKSSDTWYTSAGDVITELPVGLSRSITIAKNRIPEEENLIPTAEMAEIPKDKAAVLVYDQTTLEVIENASVTVNGTDVYPTDGSGMVLISATDEEVSYALTVAAEGYEITETVQNIKNGKLARVGLKPEGSDLAVVSVTGSLGNIRYDLLRDKIVWGYMSDISGLTNTTEQTMTVSVKANEDVKTYSIIDQNGKQYFTSTDGIFEIRTIISGTTSDNNTISTRMPVTDKLTDGKYYYVQIETTDGRKTREKIGISLTKNYVTAEKMYQKTELSIGEKIEITLPDSIPILGGMKCKFDLDKDAPLEININEEGVVRVTYNKPTDEELDDFAKKYKGMAKKASQNAKMKLNKVPGALDKFGMGFGSVSGKVYGYGEGNLKEAAEGGKLTVTLQIGAEIEGEIGYKQYFIIGAVPINVYIKDKAKGSVEVNSSITDWDIESIDITGGKITLSNALTVGGGVGVGAEVNASATGSLNYTYKPATAYQKGWTELSGKVSLVLLCFEEDLWKSKKYKKVFLEKGGTKAVDVAASEIDSATEAEFVSLNRSYLNYDTNLASKNNSVSYKDSIVKEVVYPAASPRMVSVNGENYLFWLEDITSRNANNRTALVYSKSEDGVTWSAPVRLFKESEDATLDGSYALSVKGDSIYITWQDAAEVISDEASVEAAAGSLTIRQAVLNTETDVVDRNNVLTVDKGYYLYPCSTVADNNVYTAFVWNELDTGDVLGNNKQHLYFVKEAEGIMNELSIPQNFRIANMTAMTYSGVPYLVCEMDTDGDFDTEADREIYTYNLAAKTSKALTSNDVSDTMPVVSDSGKIYWYSNNNIVCANGPDDSAPASLWSEDLLTCASVISVTTDANGKDVLLWEAINPEKEDGSIAVFYSKEEEGTYSLPAKCLETDGTMASSISAVWDSGKVLGAHLVGGFLEDGSMLKSLQVFSPEDIVDIRLDYATLDVEDEISGESEDLGLQITNIGNTVADTINVYVNDEQIGTVTNAGINPGESKEVFVTYKMPADLSVLRTYKVKAVVENEKSLDENTDEFELGGSDLYVDTEQRLENGKTWIDVNVFNDNSQKSDGTVIVHKDSVDGEVIYEKEFSDLHGNEGVSYTFDIGNYESESTRYYVEVVDSNGENNLGDNEEFVYTGYGTGIDVDTTDSEDEVSSLALNVLSKNLKRGETFQLMECGNPDQNWNAGDLLWLSSDCTVASVDDDGLVTAHRAGTATIFVLYGEISAECEVTVGEERRSGFTIQLDSQGGQRFEPITGIVYGEKVSLPSELTREGYIFTGWYTLPEDGERVENEEIVVEKSMTLYAHWMAQEEALDGIWIFNIPVQNYSGIAIKPIVWIYDEIRKLKQGTDYTITYKNNKNAYTYTDEDYAAFEENLKLTGKRTKVGTFDPKKAPQITVKMKGNYSGSRVIYFKIEQADITGDAFETGNLTVTYTGKKQTPTPKLTWNGKALKYGTDFYIPEYDAAKKDKTAFKDTGTYNLTITGKKNFTGEIPVTLTISESKKQIAMNKVKVTGIKNMSWNGDQIKQTGFSVKYGKDVLSEENGDYTIEWGENTEAGIGTVTFIGTGTDEDGDGFSYIGSKKVSFKINGTAMSKVKVSGVKKSYSYTGTEITPEVSLTYKPSKNAQEIPLTEGTHYTVSYQKNVDKGTATILFTGLASGGYTGTKKVTFKITSAGVGDTTEGETTIENIQIAFADTENIQDGVYVAPYMKGGTKPEVIVTSGDKTLEAGKDYKVSYSNNKKPALSTDTKAPTVTVTGKGNYKGSKSETFTIEAKALSNENGITVVAKDKVENLKKNGYRQSFKVYDKDGKALGNKDYDTSTVTYTLIRKTNEDGTASEVNEPLGKNSIVPAGSIIRITVQGKGIYAGGEASGTYRILEKNYDISKATIQINNQPYTGNAILITDQSQFKEGKVFIKMGNQKKELILGQDIEVVRSSYVKNVNKGTAKVTFRGINDFGGTKTVSFKIGVRSITDFWKGIYAKMAELWN